MVLVDFMRMGVVVGVGGDVGLEEGGSGSIMGVGDGEGTRDGGLLAEQVSEEKYDHVVVMDRGFEG
jgi:hypothetical protein